MVHLTTFTTAVVVLAPDQYKMLKDMRPAELPDLVVKEMTSNWRILKAQMEPDSGPGRLVGGTDGGERRLIVHPGSIADLWHKIKTEQWIFNLGLTSRIGAWCRGWPCQRKRCHKSRRNPAKKSVDTLPDRIEL